MEFLENKMAVNKKFNKLKANKDINKKWSKRRFMKYFGALENMDIDWEEKEKAMKEFRRSFNRRINNTINKMNSP